MIVKEEEIDPSSPRQDPGVGGEEPLSPEEESADKADAPDRYYNDTSMGDNEDAPNTTWASSNNHLTPPQGKGMLMKGMRKLSPVQKSQHGGGKGKESNDESGLEPSHQQQPPHQPHTPQPQPPQRPQQQPQRPPQRPQEPQNEDWHSSISHQNAGYDKHDAAHKGAFSKGKKAGTPPAGGGKLKGAGGKAFNHMKPPGGLRHLKGMTPLQEAIGGKGGGGGGGEYNEMKGGKGGNIGGWNE